MWYPPTVSVTATSEPVTLTEAKAQCRVDDSDSDDLLTLYIAAARNHIEGYCGTPLVSRTVVVKCDRFSDFAQFPVPPLVSVTSVSYVDSTGATQTLSTDVYEVRTDGLTASLTLKDGQSWPAIQSAARITVTAVVGYSTVPDAIKASALLLIGQWYDTRADAVERQLAAMPNGVAALLANHRAYSF